MGTYLVIKNNFRRNFNHKLLFTISFLFPLLLCLAAGLANKIGKSDLRVGIITQEKVAREKIEKLLNTTEFDYMETAKASINSDLITGKFHIIVDFTNPGSSNQPLIRSVQSRDKLTGGTESLTKTERAAAYLMTLFMVMAVVQGSVIIRDKSAGTLERYCYSLQNKRSYYAGFFLHNLILTFIQGEIAVLIMRAMDKEWELSVWEGILAAAMIALISVTFTSLICGFNKSDMNANITASSIAVIFSLLGGTFVAVGDMPRLFQVISVISPIRWIIEFIRWI